MNANASYGNRYLLLAPRILFAIALLVLLSGLVVQWMADPHAAALPTVVIAFYLIWLICEVPVTFQSVVPMKDTRTLIPYALARIATIAACVLIPTRTPWIPLGLFGAMVFVAGVVLREVAIKTLGCFYSHHVARRPDQVTVTHGLYRYVRHPAYAGMLLAHAGLVTCFPHPLSLTCLVLLIVAVIWRILVEEQALWSMPGYAEYAEDKARICPGVW